MSFPRPPCLFREGHVIFAQFARFKIIVDMGFPVPKGQLARLPGKVGGKYPLQVRESSHVQISALKQRSHHREETGELPVSAFQDGEFDFFFNKIALFDLIE